LDQESVDCCEMRESTQESSEKMMKNDEEMNDYGDTVETCHKRHKNFYRMKQNDDATDFDDSFLCIGQFDYEEAIYASEITEKVSLVSKNDVQSENYAVEASKH